MYGRRQAVFFLLLPFYNEPLPAFLPDFSNFLFLSQKAGAFAPALPVLPVHVVPHEQLWHIKFPSCVNSDRFLLHPLFPFLRHSHKQAEGSASLDFPADHTAGAPYICPSPNPRQIRRQSAP